jgi:oxygen-independent coproporphyrinogen-3 oxidase
LKDFYRAIDANELPIEKGVRLNQDDLIRRTAIMELMCQFKLSAPALEEKYHLGFDIDFNDYFAKELAKLDTLEADRLIERWGDGIEVTPIGRLLIRNIASVFDAYLKPEVSRGFSKSV